MSGKNLLKPHGSPHLASGFTLIGLVVVTAGMAMLALLLLPTLSRSRQQSTNNICLNNLKQLTLAWNAYNQDNRGRFPADEEGDVTMQFFAPEEVKPWVNGWLNYSGGTDWSDTNVQFLINGQYTSMGPYVGSPGPFKCPADPSCAWGRTGQPRVRSVSMNNAIGTAIDGTIGGIGLWLNGGNGPGPYLIYSRESDISRPSPANLWLFIDEHPDSINDGTFAIEMSTISDNSAYWADHPTCLHNGACGVGFCDGHAVMHKWTESNWKSTLDYIPAYTGRFGGPNPVTGLGNTADLRWLGGHTSAKKDPTQALGFTMVPD